MSEQTRSRKILIIDDDRSLHLMLGTILSANHFDVVSAHSGEEGLVLAAQERPDMIVLDVMMPGIKGREVCRRIKADPLTRAIPVLFLTAKDSEDDVQAELALGAVGHVTKPINSMTVIRKIKQTLGV